MTVVKNVNIIDFYQQYFLKKGRNIIDKNPKLLTFRYKFSFQLANIERGKLQINTFIAIKLAHDLQKNTNLTKELYGADVLIIYDLIKELFLYESRVQGLNLTHSQDKNYINNLVHSMGTILSKKYTHHWKRIKELIGEGVEDLIELVERYIKVLSLSQHDTYTNPFEIVSSNMGK